MKMRCLLSFILILAFNAKAAKLPHLRAIRHEQKWKTFNIESRPEVVRTFEKRNATGLLVDFNTIALSTVGKQINQDEILKLSESIKKITKYIYSTKKFGNYFKSKRMLEAVLETSQYVGLNKSYVVELMQEAKNELEETLVTIVPGGHNSN